MAGAFTLLTRRAFALVVYLPVPLFCSAMVLTLIFSDHGEETPLSAAVAVVGALALWASGGIWTIDHLRRRRDLTEARRNRWIIDVTVFGPIAIPLAWRKLIRDWSPSSTLVDSGPRGAVPSEVGEDGDAAVTDEKERRYAARQKAAFLRSRGRL